MLKKFAIGILALTTAPLAYAQDSILQAEPFVPATKAAAQVAPTVAKPLGPWKTGVIRAKDGQFQYCISEARYSNGKVLVLALNPLGQINVGLGQPGNTTVPSGERDFTIKIDSRYSRTLPAKAMNPELTVVSAGEDKAFMSAFASGNSVSFTEGDTTESFSLKGTTAAISQIRECVQVSVGAAPAPAPEVNTTPAATEEPATPAAEAPAPAAAAVEAPVNPVAEVPVAPAPDAEKQPEVAVTEAPGEDEIKEVKSIVTAKVEEDVLPLPQTSEPPIQVREEVREDAATEALTPAPASETPVAANEPVSLEPVAPTEAPVVAAEPAPVAPAPAVASEAAPAAAPVAVIETAAVTAPATEGKVEGKVLEMPTSTPPVAALPEVTLPPAEAQAPAAAARVVALPAQLKTLLEGAGLKNVSPLAPSQLSLPADFAWTSGKLQGGVKETVVPADSELSNLVTLRVEELSAACEGKPTIKLGRMEKVGALQTQIARLTCIINGEAQVNSLLFVLSRDGVFSTVFHHGGNGDVSALLKATNGFAASIRNTQG